MEARLPDDKLDRMQETVTSWLPEKKATKRAILSLVGILQHATKIVRPGRIFLRRMYSTAARVCELHYYTWLGKEFRSDLSWWHVFLVSWNGISLMRYMGYSATHHYTRCLRILGLWSLLPRTLVPVEMVFPMGPHKHKGKGAGTDCT